MSMCIVLIREIKVDLDNEPTITIVLPNDYRTNYISDAYCRQQIQSQKSLKLIKRQIQAILYSRKGVLATADHPIRSYGAGILPCILPDCVGPEVMCILHLRGSNRGSVWPMKSRLDDVMCWKEFAGVTGSPEELLNPKLTAVKELYEELALVSNDQILFPSDIQNYEDTFQQVTLAIKRLRNHYDFHLSPVYGYYSAITPDHLKGDPGTTVLITDGRKEEKFNAIVSYDPYTNALEISFVANLMIRLSLTGILSLSGPENDKVELSPYMEDIIVIKKKDLAHAKVGQRLSVKHLLSVHGPTNFTNTEYNHLFFVPASTLKPIVAFLEGNYSFEGVLAEAESKL